MSRTPASSVDQGLQPLTTLDELDLAVARSDAAPVFLFKHSSTCGLSAQAHEEVSTFLQDASLHVDACLVLVLEHRPVSNAIAARFGVRHESPQVLMLREGRVAWHGSHASVNAADLRAAWRRTVGPAAS